MFIEPVEDPDVLSANPLYDVTIRNSSEQILLVTKSMDKYTISPFKSVDLSAEVVI